ncbi:hypothetical protein BJX70DRAFT_71596 [Aspergillus crustosus]
MGDNLSQTLSARSFLPEQHQLPHFRVKSAQSHSDFPKPDNHNVDAAKRRGRPKMAPVGDPARADRRTQVRYAQRTYRHKKKAMYRGMEQRVIELEQCMNRVEESFMEFYDMAVESDLHITHPQLFQRLRDTVTDVQRVTGGKEENPYPSRDIGVFPAHAGPDGNTSSFGYMVNCFDEGEAESTQQAMTSHPTPSRKRQKTQHYHRRHQDINIEPPLPFTTPKTYSYQETTPIRILHRHCLEHIYRLFTNPHTNPQEFYRVFRLVPCVKWKEKMGKYLLCLVRSGSDERLDIPALPFCCIGGAGTHYPEVRDGVAVYPEKMRLPRRVLGNVVGLVPGEDVLSVDRQKLLKLAGLDGIWLDCRDVVGYLHEKGVLGSKPGYSNSREVSMKLDLEGFFHCKSKNQYVYHIMAFH